MLKIGGLEFNMPSPPIYNNDLEYKKYSYIYSDLPFILHHKIMSIKTDEELTKYIKSKMREQFDKDDISSMTLLSFKSYENPPDRISLKS